MSGLTTQLDTLSMATDDTNRYPTTSKFPKTRPNELNSKQGESGQEIALIANYIKILATPTCMFLYILLFIIRVFLYFCRGFISIPLFIRTRCKFSFYEKKSQ